MYRPSALRENDFRTVESWRCNPHDEWRSVRRWRWAAVISTVATYSALMWLVAKLMKEMIQ